MSYDLTSSVALALHRIRTVMERLEKVFDGISWVRVSGSGPETLINRGGVFHGLKLISGERLHLRCRLELTHSAQGVVLAGAPLEASLNTLYPVSIFRNDEKVIEVDGVPGPALFILVPEIIAGDNGTVDLIIQSPANQMTNWAHLLMTTHGLRARWEQLDIAWAQLALAENIAETEQEKACVVQAAGALQLLETTEDQAALDAMFADVAKMLLPLSEKVQRHRVHLIGHAHIDLNWLWTYKDTVETIRRDLLSVLQLMEDFPEFTFSHSQPATYEIFQQREPEKFEKIVEHIKAGRWETTTLQWAEGDTNMASGESQVRQLLEGVRYSRSVLGTSPTLFHAPDTFGHAGNLPQLIASAGGASYYHHRCNPGGADQWPAYWWEGQDGSRILGISTPGYNGVITAGELARAAIRARLHKQTAALHFHGVGDHGGGPVRQNLQSLKRFQKTTGLPTAFCSTLAKYTEDLLAGSPELPVHRGECRTIFEGCYTTHADTKRFNRHGENLLTTADTLCVLANIDRRNEHEIAWRKVLFNQFHDILDGSAIHEAYQMNADDFEQVKETADRSIESALRALGSRLDASQIAVTNPLGFDRKDVVLVAGERGEGDVWLIDATGRAVPGQWIDQGLIFIATVPALSTVGYRIDRTRPEGSEPIAFIPAVAVFSPLDNRQSGVLGAAAIEPPYLRVETDAFRVYVRRDCGVFVSFFDKRANRELVGFGMRRPSDYLDTARPDLGLNVLQFFQEHPHSMSAWQLHEVHSDQSLLKGATTKVVEEGPVRCVLEVAHRLRSSTIIQRIIFYRKMDRVDFELKIDWQEIGDATAGVPGLKVAFNTRMLECEAWCETPFGAARRPADGQEVPALRWCDVGGEDYGAAILNDSKYGHDVLGTRMRLTLLRSAYEPDAISDVGEHHIRYAFLPHENGWRTAGVARAAAGFNQPLIAHPPDATATHSFPAAWPIDLHLSTGIDLSCLKHASDGRGVIARFFDSGGDGGTVSLRSVPARTIIHQTNVVEDDQKLMRARKGILNLKLTPWQVRTIRIEPAAEKKKRPAKKLRHHADA